MPKTWLKEKINHIKKKTSIGNSRLSNGAGTNKNAVTEGGIHLVQSTVDRESLATVVGYVVKMGPDCYKDSSKFTGPWCQEKQWVLIGRYAGARFRLGDESECRIINDDEVIATILDPDDILAV
jgi:co-chaperonin GroES (HSP10)